MEATDFTPEEAEFILREKWDDAQIIGGLNPWQRHCLVEEYRKLFGDAIEGYDLLGETSWCGYEDSGCTSLWEKDGLLWVHEMGGGPFGDHGYDFDPRVALMSDWLEQVHHDNNHDINS